MTDELAGLRDEAMAFLTQMRIGDGWEFRFSLSTDATLIGSSLAAMLGGLVGWTDALDATERADWAERISRRQRPDGWFEDEDIAERNLSPGYGKDRALLHRTRHALMAMEALGARPAQRLAMIDPWLDAGAMRAWCETLDLSDYWYASNMMMDAAVLLLKATAWWSEPGADRAVDELLDFCDEHINPDTGYHDAGESEVRNAMAGAMHLYPVYVAARRPILYAREAIRTTLGLQQPDGLFSYESGTGGEDCLDYDAVIILTNLGLQTPELRGPIEACFERLRPSLGALRNADGGFSPHRRDETYFFGTQTTPVRPGQSSIWATYSRLMTYVAVDGFMNKREPAGWCTAHNVMEIWDGGVGLASRAVPGQR